MDRNGHSKITILKRVTVRPGYRRWVAGGTTVIDNARICREEAIEWWCQLISVGINLVDQQVPGPAVDSSIPPPYPDEGVMSIDPGYDVRDPTIGSIEYQVFDSVRQVAVVDAAIQVAIRIEDPVLARIDALVATLHRLQSGRYNY